MPFNGVEALSGFDKRISELEASLYSHTRRKAAYKKLSS